MGLLKFLFITICILWLVRFVFRLLLPLLLQRLFNKVQNQATQGTHRSYEYSSKKQGSVHVDYIPPKDKEARAADKAGEFVDYEEIKER
ncbi:DUF4834 family protein [Rubrolithibacter danxiaensis]|uniref:DUF4834 family protein n=1 Tax=Rubrolithibacter danxiaensis TaxID=3390805 RepID=UPI003BF7ED1F